MIRLKVALVLLGSLCLANCSDDTVVTPADSKVAADTMTEPDAGALEGDALAGLTTEIGELLVGRWELDWDALGSVAAMFKVSYGVASFHADGWGTYDVLFPNLTPPMNPWCRRYIDWTLENITSKGDFTVLFTFTQDTCGRGPTSGKTEEPWGLELTFDGAMPAGIGNRAAGNSGGAIPKVPWKKCSDDLTGDQCGHDTQLGDPTKEPPQQ